MFYLLKIGDQIFTFTKETAISRVSAIADGDVTRISPDAAEMKIADCLANKKTAQLRDETGKCIGEIGTIENWWADCPLINNHEIFRLSALYLSRKLDAAKPAARHNHKPDPDYLRALVDKTGLSQRACARAIGIDERTFRYYLDTTDTRHECPYSVQFCLERLAGE